MEGKTYILYNNGLLYKRNFKKSRLDLNEFLMQCRIAGYFNLAEQGFGNIKDIFLATYDGDNLSIFKTKGRN